MLAIALGGGLVAVGAKAKGKRRKHPRYPTEIRPYQRKTYPDHGLRDEMTSLGRKARGFYLTPYYHYKVGPEAASRVMKRARMNAVVIDVKDDWGNVLWPSKVPLAQKVRRSHMIKDPRAAVQAFHRAGIYVIARIVCFKDSRLPHVRPDLSVRFSFRPTRLFNAGAGWIDQYSAEVQDYITDLALEWQSYGVDEVQLDYIRFPKGKTGTLGLWLHKKDDSPTRAKLIAGFLDRVDRALKIPLSVDIYGLTTLVDGDPRKLGQTVEGMATYVEAISPMLYANGMTSYFKGGKLNEGIYGLIQCGIWRARLKAPQIVLRPFIQAYPNSVPFFDEAFIQKQVLSAEKAGADGFLFWNSTMKNGVAFRGLRRLPKQVFTRFETRPGTADRHPPERPGAWCKKPGEGDVFARRRPAN